MNVPKLRFKEFNGEYNNVCLNTLSKKITNKNKDNIIKNVISNSAIYGLISQRDFFDKDIANNDNTNNYFIIEKGDFVYNPRKSNEAPYGPINLYKFDEKGVISPLYLCFKTSHINNNYLEYYFKSSFWHRYIYLNGDSGARHDRVSIKDDIFFEMKINIPNESEQLKVANFLSLLDKKIELQTKKVEDLKLFKKGLLSIFFKDKQTNTTIEKCIDYGKAGGTPSSNNKDYYNGTIPFLSISDITNQGKYITSTEKNISQKGLDNSSAWLIPKHSLILSMYASYGLVTINKIELSTSQAMFNMIVNKKNNIEYIYYYLEYLYENNHYDKIVSTGTQANLNADKVKNIKIYLPNIKEQNKISAFFQIIDYKLDYEYNKLKCLVKLKKGFMQNMFV